LVGESGCPNGAVSCFLDVVLIRAFYDVEPAILEHGLQSFICDDFVEPQWLICEIFGKDLYAYVGSTLDILIGSILDATDDIGDFKIIDSNSSFAADECFELLDWNELAVDFNKVKLGATTDIKEHAHINLL